MRHLSADVERIERSSLGPARFRDAPYVVMLSGLPGVGKSTVCRELCRRLGAAVVESDAVRWALFPQPTFDAEESAYVFQVVHSVMARLLRRGVPVIMDATNVLERHREAVYEIAEGCGAPLHVLRIAAPAKVVKRRLESRGAARGGHDYPVARWDIYRRMRESAEPIGRDHHLIDTSGDYDAALERFVETIENATTRLERKR